MIFVRIEAGKAVEAVSEHQHPFDFSKFESRHDWETLAQAHQRATELNQLPTERRVVPFIAIDNGSNVWPRFDIVERPFVGDEVSYSFNGDTYPDGKIVSISAADKNFRIVKTDTGSRYFRKGNSGRWVKTGGTWSLVKGHRNERNPSF